MRILRTARHGEQERTAHRRIHCPAFGTTCSTCGRLHHLAHMCWQQIEHESAVSEQIFAMHEGTLQHQTWDQDSHTWSQRRSPPQPNIAVMVSAREDFRAHGHTLARETHHLATTAMVPELPSRPHTYVEPPPVRERAHPGEPRYALGQWNQSAHPRGRTTTHPHYYASGSNSPASRHARWFISAALPPNST